MFTRIKDYYRSNGSSLQSGVTIVPSRVVDLFGSPDDSDGYKVSMEWLFEDEEGNVVTLYDWKSTSLYEEGLPSPVSVINSVHPLHLHVGAHDYQTAVKFVDWLLLQGEE